MNSASQNLPQHLGALRERMLHPQANFQEEDTGIAVLIPGVSGPMEVARFHLTAPLPDPRLN